MRYKIIVISRPCGLTDRLLELLPRIQMLYPHLSIETDVREDACQGQGFPQTRVLCNDRVQALLYGFRTEEQHLSFISSIVDVQWECRLAS